MLQDPTSECSAIVNDIKERIEAKAEAIDPTYTKYVNFPSCSNPSWAEKYWGSGVSTLETIKTEWDPDNLFNHCQSIGSSPVSGQGCCPFSDTVTTTTTARSDNFLVRILIKIALINFARKSHVFIFLLAVQVCVRQ